MDRRASATQRVNQATPVTLAGLVAVATSYQVPASSPEVTPAPTGSSRAEGTPPAAPTESTAGGAPREAWIAATAFHPLEQGQILNEALAQVTRAREQALSPLVILDLDSTLYSGAPRNARILQEWLGSDDAKRLPDDLRRRLESLTLRHYGYYAADTFERAGLDIESPVVAAAIRAFEEFWGARFFTNDYVVLDIPNPGAVSFAQALVNAGARLVYLTGRDLEGMEAGTIEALQRDRFPFGEPHLLITKPHKHTPDVEFKRSAVRELNRHGVVVATFDNEPRNVMVYADAYPDAMNVFVDTECSANPARIGNGLYRIENFIRD